MLKYYSYLSGIIFLLLTLPSCEEVIEIDLANAKEVMVIEALIINENGPFTVKVSKTTPYFGTPVSNPVSGAKVRVRTEAGKTKYFRETLPGRYELNKAQALPGFWYYVDVEYDGVTYTAKSYMYEKVQIAELGFTYFDGFGIFESGYKVTTFIRDPANIENYYRIKYYVNGKPQNTLGGFTLYNDQLYDGKAIGLSQRSQVFQKTDTLTVELQTIDKATYDYFSTLESISGLDVLQSVSPANPISNFNNGALGYFSAYTFDKSTVVIKDYIDE